MHFVPRTCERAPAHAIATCMKFWGLIVVSFTCWLHVRNVSESKYIFRLEGLFKDWLGVIFLFMCFGGSCLISYRGEKNAYKQNPQKIAGQSHENFVCFSSSNINSVHTRCIVKTSGFTRGICKNQGFIKFKGFLVEFLENRRSWENQKPPEIARKVDFSEPRLLQCT